MSTTNLPYPNDRDGGGLRVAGIKSLERKVAMAKNDGDAERVARYESQLEEYRDTTKTPSGSSIVIVIRAQNS